MFKQLKQTTQHSNLCTVNICKLNNRIVARDFNTTSQRNCELNINQTINDHKVMSQLVYKKMDVLIDQINP